MAHRENKKPAPPPIDPARIDPDADKVVRRLARHGFDAYLVGGCVRDLLLDLEPKDFDIATNATPRQIRRLFRNSRIIGRRFRLAHIHFGPRILEVATFRAPPLNDDESDLYVRRDNVFGTAEQDAYRRDFTINGLFYDVGAQRVIDHVAGVPDLEARLLRVIGDPDIRLREDPVRILRAARFAGRLDFDLCPELREAAVRHADDLRKAAPPRVLEELFRLLSSRGCARAFRLLEELGSLEVLVPEICPLTEGFFVALERLADRTAGSRQAVTQSTLLAVLLWPCVRAGLESRDVPDPEQLVAEAMQPLLDRFVPARKDTAYARQILAAQARLAQLPHGKRAHRFCRRETFLEALALREIVGPIHEDDEGTPELWGEFVKRHDEERPPRSKRRRRRRRRGRGLSNDGQQGKDEACPPSGSSSAPAPKTPPKASPRDSSGDGSAPA